MDGARPSTYNGEIKGHVWDDEKKKYFRIIPSHLATPSQRKYTIEHIQQQREVAKRRKLDEDAKHKHQAGRIKQSRVLHASTLPAVDLRRSMGRDIPITQSRDARVAALVAALGCEISEPCSPDLRIHRMVADATSQQINIGGYRQGSGSICAQIDPGAWSHSFHVTKEQLIHTGDRTSIWRDATMSPSGIPCFVLARIPEDQLIVMTALQSSDNHARFNPTLHDATLMMIWQPGDDIGSIHSVAANPSSTRHTTYALGHNRGFSLFSLKPYPPLDADAELHLSSAVLALDWLTEHVLALGLSNGHVRLFDTRNNGHVDRLRCHSKINFLRCVDENRLVMRGVEQELGLWDLRLTDHCKSDVSCLGLEGKSKCKSQGKSKRKPRHGRTDLPAVRYRGVPGTASDGGRQKGLDLLPGLDLLAAADTEGGVLIFRISTGALLRRLTVPSQGPADLGSRIQCLLLVDDPDGGDDDGAPRGLVVLGGRESRLVRWDCGI